MFGEPRNPVEKEICDLEQEFLALGQKISKLREDLPPEEVTNYELVNTDGSKTSLLELFGEKDELLLVHNMGPGCPYCTLWADGFKGFVPYIEARCAFVIETDQPAEKWKAFSEERGWNYPAVSSLGTTLKKDLGFWGEHNGKSMNLPGVSSFFKEGDKVFRHATSPFGPGDMFCSPWHLFSLLKKGVNGWQPQFNK